MSSTTVPKKLVRFELQYEDGSIDRLTGKAANDYLEELNGMLVFAAVHGVQMKAHPFERLPPPNK